MTIHTWLLRRKWILLAVGLPVLVALWWAFRPEKLSINEKVNEPAAFDASSDPQPILTGRFEGKAQQTTGRATIYKKPTGEKYLRLSDPDVRKLARSLGRHREFGIETGPISIDIARVYRKLS